ncbi:hypothetical protein DN069_12935 [Streptacidiphilus pinicola]|uniref:Uncharacterized protein n=1 Tax=Streptacidiphilus pinicola TaxID=2219663 RepID=A0A2X0JC88_9ACTN|nr:hypothetical protein [Streptacidiphilus pinicola]RAG85198.1 hypothetical protein DN069_12935 [Streptacidiphilus pinicola]
MTAAGVLYPLEQVAREFRALVERPVPLEMKTADLGEGLPDGTVDVVALRALLLHPALGHPTRGAVWARLFELAGLGGREGQDWRLAAVGMALPGLTRVSMRWAQTVKTAGPEDRAEIQMIVLGGFWEQFAAMQEDGTWRRDPARIPARLLWAAERAARAALTRASRVREAEVELEHVPAARDERVQPEQLLAVAVRKGIISAKGARIVAWTRLDGTPMAEVTRLLGGSRESLFMLRTRTERKLAGAIASGRLSSEDVELNFERLDRPENSVS